MKLGRFWKCGLMGLIAMAMMVGCVAPATPTATPAGMVAPCLEVWTKKPIMKSLDPPRGELVFSLHLKEEVRQRAERIGVAPEDRDPFEQEVESNNFFKLSEPFWGTIRLQFLDADGHLVCEQEIR